MNFPHASETFRKLNPHLFGVARLPVAQPQSRRRRGAQGAAAVEEVGPCRVVVSLVSFRRVALDDDNLNGGFKWLRDAIARSLGLDDADPRLRFECAQVITKGQTGTAVKIEVK